MTARRAAVALLALEGVAAVTAGIAFGVAAAVGHPSDRGTAVFLAALLVVFGAAIAVVARGIHRTISAARTPAYLVQFFGLIVAWYQRNTLVAVTAALAVVALTAGAALVLADRDHPPA